MKNINQKFWQLVAQIPLGKVTTYKELAKAAGLNNPRHAGKLLNSNQEPEKYPCHRVIRSDGKLANGFAFGGPEEQRFLLLKEGIKFEDNKINLTNYLYTDFT